MTTADTEVREEVHNIAYERIVLGSMITEQRAIELIEQTELSADDFYKPQHASLYRAILDIHAAGRPTEPVALAQQLADRGILGEIGGGKYLHDLMAAVTTVAEAPWYAEELRGYTRRRNILQATSQLTYEASRGGDVDRLAALAQGILASAMPRTTALDMVSLGEFAGIGTADIEMRKDRSPGLMTGIIDLDKLLGGMRPGQLIVVAARPGCGKSTLALDIARRVSIREKLVTGFFCMEMSTQEMFDRCLSAESGVPYQIIRDGTLTDDDWAKASAALGPMSEAPLFFDDSVGQSLPRIANRLKKLNARHGLDFVVLDYLQLISSGRRIDNRQQEVATVVRGVKDLAGEMQVPILGLVQLNRNPEQRTDKAPQLADMRDSGELEQAAHAVIMLHRDDLYDTESARAGECDFIVRKNRGGPQDTVTVAAQLHRCRFVDMALPEPS